MPITIGRTNSMMRSNVNVGLLMVGAVVFGSVTSDVGILLLL